MLRKRELRPWFLFSHSCHSLSKKKIVVFAQSIKQSMQSSFNGKPLAQAQRSLQMATIQNKADMLC